MRTVAGHIHRLPPADRPSPSGGTVDVLLLSVTPLAPMDTGSCVHGSRMLDAMRGLGYRVAAAVLDPAPGAAALPPELADAEVAWPPADAVETAETQAAWSGPLAAARRRLARYHGLEPHRVAGARRLVRRLRPSLVLGLGIYSPILLQGLRDLGAPCIWYAADEWIRFHLTCLRRESPGRWPHRLLRLGVDGAMESLFGPALDGVIGVSPTDTDWLRGVTRADARTIRNGVDLEHFAPASLAPTPDSVVFWGNLGFEPNRDAVAWFARRVWPTLHDANGSARWRVVGRRPEAVQRIVQGMPGVELVGEVDDVRRAAHASALTILPMRSGGGIKNKLLEAASMGRPIVASPRAVAGLETGAAAAPWREATTARQWAEAVLALWRRPEEAARLGDAARRWAAEHHRWSDAARALARWAQLPEPASARQVNLHRSRAA